MYLALGISMAVCGGAVALLPDFPSEHSRGVLYAAAAGIVGLTSAAVVAASKR